MEFIYPEPGRIDFDRSARYVESIRDRLPAHVHAFASDHRFFDMTTRSSLHDARLESFTVKEAASGERHEIRRLEIEIILLGPFHDLRTRLHYTGVIRYSAFATAKPGHPRYEHTGHGELITHEVRLGESGSLLHEILFERGATTLIECSDIRHSEALPAVAPTPMEAGSPPFGLAGMDQPENLAPWHGQAEFAWGCCWLWPCFYN